MRLFYFLFKFVCINISNIMDRRGFIKTSSVAAVAASILPSGSLFAKDIKQIRLGYIGVGMRGRSHVGLGLRREDVNIVAICDTQEDSLARCREQFKSR